MSRSGNTLILLFGLCFLWNCTSSPPSENRIQVTASIFPLADIVRNIGGDRVDVDVLIPPGASPHVFEPTPGAFRKFARTRLFVMVGAGLEFWAQKLIAATAEETLTVVKAAEGVPLIQMAGYHHGASEHGQEDAEHQSPGNPHVWLDPLVARSLAERVAQSLIRLDPEHAGEYRERVTAYGKQLDALDQTIREMVGSFQISEYVAFHPAWSYFARRYGLKEVGVIQESPGREPTPKDIEKIIRTIERYGIRAIFAEPQLNPSAASSIASEAGVKVLILDPLGGPDFPGRRSYIDLMKYNVNVMREAMG